MENYENEIQYRPIVIDKSILDILQKEELGYGLLALYVFYYYTAIWQKTNQPHATIPFVAKGLHASTAKVRKWKRRLIELNLIKEVNACRKGIESRQQFIQVMYYHSPLLNKFPAMLVSGRAENHKANAYSKSNKTNKNLSYEINKNLSHGVFSKNNSFKIKTKPSFETKIAQILNDTITIGGKITRKVSLKRWSSEIRKLRTTDTITKNRIRAVVNWYRIHIMDKYVPQIYKTTDFREKFIRIEDAMKRDIPEKTITEVSPEAKKVINRISYLSWPKGSSKDLPIIVEQSLNAYKPFHNQYRLFLRQIKTKEKIVSEPIKRFSKYLMVELCEPIPFIEGWMKRISNNITGWEEWNGSLFSMSFNPQSKMFNQLGYKWACDFCGNPTRWNEFLKAMKE